jgi:hypothetical protein
MTTITEIIPDDAPDWAIEAMAEGQLFRTCFKRDKELREKYEELIYQVETKYPNESRHETAKRYIHERENRPLPTASAETEPKE